MNNIYLLNYNDYFNRIVKKEKTIDDYRPYIVSTYEGLVKKQGVFRANFIPNDGVDTTQQINWKGPNPNYVLITDNNDENIVSRWFVVDSTRTSAGQYNLTLRRDVLVDFTVQIVNSLSYIEKAMLDINDSFIYNTEGLQFNQIKISEELLQDNASPENIAWLTAYIAKNENFGSIKIGDSLLIDYYGLENLPFGGDETKKYTYVDKKQSNYSLEFKFKSRPGKTPYDDWYDCKRVQQSNYNDSFQITKKFVTSDWATLFTNKLDAVPAQIQEFLKVITDRDSLPLLDDAIYYNDSIDLINYIGDVNLVNKTLSDLQAMEKANNKIVRISSSQYKRVKVKKIQRNKETLIDKDSQLYKDIIRVMADNQPSLSLQDPNGDAFRLTVEYYEYSYSFEDISEKEFSGEVDLTNRGRLRDQVYDIIAIPINVKDSRTVIHIKDDSGVVTSFTQDNLLAFNTITTIASTKAAAVYDIQLLPYCPVRACFDKYDNNKVIMLDKEKVNFNLIKESGGSANKGVILSSKSSQTSFTILYNYEKATSALEKKVKAETEMYRLSSPGYDSNFEFNAEKNNGVSYFNVDVTFKPFTPFIHIAPNFGGLYGSDFRDMRGLTCSGDFSLGRTEDKFATYELENKNYQKMFDREIQHMESSNDVAMGKGVANGIIGAIGGGLIGSLTGPQIFPGPGGALIGGAVGAASSMLGATTNLVATDIQHEIDIDYKKDRFMMNLQNIKALPYSLSKVSAFCQNNKIFPVLEFYRATRKEQDAFREKIKYDGMTVGRIGRIAEYIKDNETFIRASVIRINSLNDDTHIALAINNEIKRGFYIKREVII